MIRVYQKIINRMKAAGLGLKKQVLNNKCLAALKACIKENGMDYELVPPEQHRQNQADWSIQTFKAHFISFLASINNKFSLLLWCHLLKPTELTLNLLRQSRVAPKILAFVHVHSIHNYIQKLFAPIGCAVQTHVKPDDRLAWDTRLEPGFNLGASIEDHQCFRVYVTRTRATRISDTVLFKHQYITSPTISPESQWWQQHNNLSRCSKATYLQAIKWQRLQPGLANYSKKMHLQRWRLPKQRSRETDSGQTPWLELQLTFQGWQYHLQGWTCQFQG